jgi:hypothetical protein
MLVSSLALCTPVSADPPAPFEKDAIPTGKGWQCARDEAAPDHISGCWRTRSACEQFVASISRDGRKYTSCQARPRATCITYRTNGNTTSSCHATAASCESYRAYLLRAGEAERLSACRSVR